MFCTPRYIILRELGIDKLKIRWGLRARKYEKKVKGADESRWINYCWIEKQKGNWKDKYSLERERYYNRNGWGITAEEVDRIEGEELDRLLVERDRDIQKQWIEERIKEAKYNKKYGALGSDRLQYGVLDKALGGIYEVGKYVRTRLRLRCGNLEEKNKYWLGEEDRKCVFCGRGWDCMEHFVKDCEKVKDWFVDLGKNEEERLRTIWSESEERESVVKAKWEALWMIWVEKRKILEAKKRVREKGIDSLEE